MSGKSVGIDFPLASLWTRFLAFMLDCVILFIPSLMMHFTVPFVGPFVVGLLYYPIFHASSLKATLGKKAMGIQVVGLDGEALTLPMAFLRYLVAVASSCALFLGHCFAFFTPKKQALHDLVVDSYVVTGEMRGVEVVNAWVLTLRRLFGKLEETAPRVFKFKPAGMKERLDELERLHDLRAKGVLSEEEYERLKRELV